MAPALDNPPPSGPEAPPRPAPLSPSEEALKVLGVLHQLTLESFLSQSRQELTFRLLNRTIMLVPYDRAALWDFGGRKPRCLGVSGHSKLEGHSEQVRHWSSLIQGMGKRAEHQVLAEGAFPPGVAQTWSALAGQNGGTAVLWLPILEEGRLLAGLWLERWGGRAWSLPELKLTASLAVSYAAAWRAHHRPPKWGLLARRLLRPNKLGLAALALLVLSLMWQVPLRVVAPCEVVPKDPWVVTAPLNGVIAEVAVQPGQEVNPGDPLFSYDKRTALEELKVARQQVEIIRSGLNRAKLQAFVDPKSRAEVGLLEHRLEQEETRLQMAQYTVGKLEVVAETQGRVVLDDPHRWRGRPVALGEMVLMIVNPQSNKVRIWLPETDNVDFDRDHPLQVVLNAFPEREHQARLTYVAQNVVTNPEGVASVLAEAGWQTEQPQMRIGLKGMAVLYGRRVPLAYWLLRKPLASARNFLGW